MRARYTAFSKGKVEFLRLSLAPEERKTFNPKGIEEWAQQSKWLGLKILSTEQGRSHDKTGIVEFVAKYSENGKVLEHHEVSKFRKGPEGEWYFVDGDGHTHEEGQSHHHHHQQKVETVVREEPKIGRNDPCHCGSGKKFKKCHGI